MTELLLLALALAADAFAVSLARGAGGAHRPLRALECGLAFGLAQALMPFGGWALGSLFAYWIEAVDHWIAFGLLAFIGARMIHEAFADEEEEAASAASQRGYYLALLAAAIATSVDAAAAGLTLGLFATPVWVSCLVIGLVTAVLCVIGYWMASRIGARFGKIAEVAGGVVLIGLGIKILLEHLGYW